MLQNVNANQLTCEDAAFTQTQNVTVQEYKDARLICTTSGTPRSIVHWVTPKHEVITLDNPDQRDLYGLSEFGDVLTVKSVRLSKTGHYKCFANNTISFANQTIALAVVLSPTSTIVYLVVACGAFMVAIVLNSVNMVMYICEHLEIKRQYRKILQAQEEEEKQNPPIKSRSRFMDESIASLNANKHYGRYDFTCQQMFLDTVIKGAHSVKKTLYDARHSDFSANVWEYAANLRDRLHIEMPSGVQLPNISMPSISMPTITMPTISMPSIPTIQDININIEKLSTSMVQRSQTLASSVGSVFTLKRWMQQQNASDNESRDSDDNLAESSITHVRVDVHSPETGLPPHLLDDEPPTPPDNQPPALVELGLHQDQQKSNNNATECRENIEIDGEICDVKPKVLRKQSLKECYAEKVVKFKPQEFYDESLAGEPFLPRLAGTGDLTSPTGDVMSPLLCTVSGAVDERYSYETSV
uniref:Ig-like domain-containing protein n=1 Tax=Ciona savignyi TaxID=51511 RepID=H2ZC69_CIOSA